ncbi:MULTISPECIES: hypothetical protein [Gilliamella]|nr:MULTISPECIES: hypothetical protein [Gilliamella]WLS92930.1 hypothetical protein RAM17_06640 [Gilliamella apis]WLT05510.1 hypothetical protein RAM11_06470 [Gilliamella apis]
MQINGIPKAKNYYVLANIPYSQEDHVRYKDAFMHIMKDMNLHYP